MGNFCCGINFNFNFNIPCDQLCLLCIQHEGAHGVEFVELDDHLRQLSAARNDIEARIQGTTPQMVSTKIVVEWSRQVATLEAKFLTLQRNWSELSQRTDNTQESGPSKQVIQNGKCFCGNCSKCIKTCCVRREIQLMDLKVLDLQKQKPVDILEKQCPAPAQQVPIEPTTGMESMLNEVWSHVENQQIDQVRLIGLYGMGAVGKTTLLKALNNKLCSSTPIFNLQLFIVISKTPIEVIQNHIGEKICLNTNDWRLKSQDEKARDIFDVIHKRKYKYILLLDELWGRLDLTKIGVPPPDIQNKSMIIFTTRSKQVCGKMKATPIEVQCLNEAAAWDLFVDTVGKATINADPGILDLAKKVMKRCSGLPHALIVFGQAMIMKTTVEDWKYTYKVLSEQRAKFSTLQEEVNEVFNRLKDSYDNLENDAIRSCFLCCSSYDEDQEISKSDLVDKWICNDFLGHDRPHADYMGYSFLNTLVDVSLLEKCSVDENVKMHVMIRSMALWIVETQKIGIT